MKDNLFESVQSFARWRHLCASLLRGVFLTILIIGQEAVAGSYELIQGTGTDVCEAHRQNLEPRHDSTPMACERRYDSKILGFVSPPWKELSLCEHFDLYREAWVYLQEHNTAPQGSKLSDQEILRASQDLWGRAQAAGVRLFKARLALTDGDRRYNLLAVREQQCGPDQSPEQTTTRLFVLNNTGTHITTDVPEIWNSYYNATIELYKKKVYLESYEPDDNWGTLLTGSGVLNVLRFTRTGTTTECKIEWTPSRASNK